MGITHLSGLQVAGVPTMGIAGLPPSIGNYWFVNSVTGSDGNPGTAQYPFATTAQAISAASANNGDVIVWTAGHAESLATAGAITVSKAGLTFWGIGDGRTAPTFTSITSTAATFVISAANTIIGGAVNTVCNIASQVTFFSVSAANVSISTTHFDTSSVVGCVTYVTTTAAADQFVFNCTYNGFTASSIGTIMCKLVGGSNATINIDAYGSWSTAIINFATTAVVNATITGVFYNGTTSFTKNIVDTVTGSTWSAVNCFDGVAGVVFSGGSGLSIQGSNAAAVQEATAFRAATVLSTGMTLFTVTGGPIEIQALVLVCVVGGDSTAATVQFSITPSSGSAQTISGASGSIANSSAGASVALAGTALATAALLNANGPNLMANPGTIFCPAGIITATIGSGPTVTGTWSAYLRYKPLTTGVKVV